MDSTTTGYKMPEDEFIQTRTAVNNEVITCPFCGADIYIFLDYQGQVFCWQCGKEIIR